VPIAIEKTIIFGFWICLDSFLSVLTILPIKFFYSIHLLTTNLLILPTRKRLSVPCKVDLLQGLLIISVCVFLHHVTDASRMYHSVRGQVSPSHSSDLVLNDTNTRHPFVYTGNYQALRHIQCIGGQILPKHFYFHFCPIFFLKKKKKNPNT
jgi:hypothetical protein